jgi:hypothetical protein
MEGACEEPGGAKARDTPMTEKPRNSPCFMGGTPRMPISIPRWRKEAFSGGLALLSGRRSRRLTFFYGAIESVAQALLLNVVAERRIVSCELRPDHSVPIDER